MTTAIIEKSSELTHVRAENEHLKNTIAELQQQVRKAAEDAQASAATLEAVNSAKAKAERHVNEMQEQKTLLQERLKDKEVDVKVLKERLAELQEKVEPDPVCVVWISPSQLIAGYSGCDCQDRASH